MSTAVVAFISASFAPLRHIAARRIARPDSNEAVPSGGRSSNVARSAMSAIFMVAATLPAASSSQAARTASHGWSMSVGSSNRRSHASTVALRPDQW